MPHRNSAALARPAARNHRVLYHPHVCPDCDSADVGQAEVDTGDGIIETALICRDCGTAWPVACVTDWQYPSLSPTSPVTSTTRN